MAATDIILVKKPHQIETWTNEQVLEFVKCADPVTGPEYFMSHFFYIQHPVAGRMLYQPFDYQKRLIDTYHRHRFSIALMPRQTGKCLSGKTIINICNTKTGKKYDLPIELYHKWCNARQANTELPDITEYEIKDISTKNI